MANVKRKLLALAITCIVSGAAFPQNRDQDKRPPKNENTRVVVKEKGEKPPPKKGDDKKGKP